MELRHVRYFLAVAEHLHFGRAAEELHTAQPSLSQQIRKLEDELGVALFERDKRHVELTPAGASFLPHARQLLELANTSMDAAKEAALGRRGRLRIGSIRGYVSDLLPEVVRRYHAAHADVTIELRGMRTATQVSALAVGDIDIAIVPTLHEAARSVAPLERLSLGEQELGVALRHDHPLAQLQSIEVSSLDGEPFVTYARASDPFLYGEVFGLLREHGITPGSIQEADDELAMLGLVSADIGVAIVPRIWEHIAVNGCVIRPLAGPRRAIEISAYWRSDVPSPVVATFVEALKEDFVTPLSREPA